MMNVPIQWVTDAGDKKPLGASLDPDTYYGEIPKGSADGLAASLVYDGDVEATATVEASDVPPSVEAATGWAAAGASGWISYATELGTKTMTGAEGAAGWTVSDFEHGRARVKLVVTVAGVCSLYATVGGN